jgi:sodium transport system ATP-binding protein
MHAFVLEARAAGVCVQFSTPTMSEADRLCDRIAILHRGRILAEGTLSDLRAATGEHYLESIFLHYVADAP